jgi:hypothetical protein
MSFTGHIADTEVARRAAMNVKLADDLNLVNDADLTSLANAKAVVDTAEGNLHIADRLYATQTKRAFDVAVAVTGNSSLFSGSALSTVYDALPAHNDHHARMIS